MAMTLSDPKRQDSLIRPQIAHLGQRTRVVRVKCQSRNRGCLWVVITKAKAGVLALVPPVQRLVFGPQDGERDYIAVRDGDDVLTTMFCERLSKEKPGPFDNVLRLLMWFFVVGVNIPVTLNHRGYRRAVPRRTHLQQQRRAFEFDLWVIRQNSLRRLPRAQQWAAISCGNGLLAEGLRSRLGLPLPLGAEPKTRQPTIKYFSGIVD